MSGELFEMIVGCLLGIEFGDTVRIRPSQGDGGVDILTRWPDGRIDVYQVKHFPNRIDWSKVKRSLNRLQDGEWFGRRVRRWYLTVPKQPTDKDVSKLDELSQGVPFETDWFAEDKLVPLVAKNPEVGDYYLGDGKAQLTQRLRDWQTVLDRMADGQDPRFEDAQVRLSEIASALGRDDPHFTYGFEVQPARGFANPTGRPGVILVSWSVVGDNAVACYVHPRYRGAEVDAADRLQIRFGLTPDALERLAAMTSLGGAPVEFGPSEIVDLELPALGHQVPEGGHVSVRVTPAVDATPAGLRLVARTADGATVVERIRRTLLRRGTSGATAEWRSAGGCVELTTVADFSTGRIQLSLEPAADVAGPITEFASDIALLRALQPGSTIAIAAGQGPLDPSGPVPIESGPFTPEFVALLDALRVIQDYTATQVLVPVEITRRHLVDIVETAALLAGLPTTGDMRGRTATVTLGRTGLGPGGPQDLFGELFALSFTASIGPELALPHQEIRLPTPLHFVRVIRSARIASVAEDAAGDILSVVLEPGPIPIWVDVRVESSDTNHDELCADLLRRVDPIEAEELTAQLARAGSNPTG